jgi:hypothetical protein
VLRGGERVVLATAPGPVRRLGIRPRRSNERRGDQLSATIQHMATCNSCQKNEGTVREWQTILIGNDQAGDVPKRIPSKTLCDMCNDEQYPYYKQTRDGGGILSCPHDV